MQKTKSRKLEIVFTSEIEDDTYEEEETESSDEGSSKKKSKQKSGTKGRIWEFLAIATVPLVLVLGNSMLVPILPDMEEKLGISKFQSSLVITLFSVTAGLIIPIAGYLSDRFSRKAIMIPSLIIYGAGGILAGFGAVWESYSIVIIARAIQGFGAAGTAPIAMAFVGDKYEGGTESKALGLIEASNGAGKVISPILGSALALLTWFAPFFAFPAFVILSLLAVMFIMKEPDKEKEPQKLGKYISKTLSILKEKGRWLIPAFFSGSLGLFILFGVLFYLSNILEEPPYNIDGVIKGCILAIPLLGLVITSYTTGALIKKNGTLMRWLMNIGMAVMTIVLALAIFFTKNIYILISLLTLSSIATGLLLPCLNTMITGSVDKSQRGMITSLYSSLRFLGVAAGPPLFGYLMNISDQIVFITVSILAFVTLGLVFFMIKPKGQIN